MLYNGYRLIIFDQKEQWHGGIGFVISPAMPPYLTTFNRVSDRVGYADFTLPLKGGGKKDIRVINCYGYTSAKAKQFPEKVTQFYKELHDTSNVPCKRELFFSGDFNAKLGNRTKHEMKSSTFHQIGCHGVGTRNDNGELMMEFMTGCNLTACNTLFDHPSRHKLSWTGANRTKKGVPLYAQLCYVLIT